jgi:hypothetical protein
MVASGFIQVLIPGTCECSHIWKNGSYVITDLGLTKTCYTILVGPKSKDKNSHTKHKVKV